MLEQHEALDILEGSGVVAVGATGDGDRIQSILITTTEGDRISICVVGNYLHVEQFDLSEVDYIEW